MIERQKRYSQAVAKASSWLANAQQADGSLGPDVTVVGEIQTVPISLALAGYPESAGRLLRYIQRVFCHVDGSFRQPSDAETLSEWCYSPSWVVIGAQLNGCFEISRPAMIDILGFQDPRTGGFFGHPRNRLAGQGTIVPSVSAVAGCAALTTGHVGAASQLGDYFLRLIAIQPDLENCFYPFFDTRHGLMTDGTPEFGPTYYGPFQRKDPGQHYWLPGFLIAFLSDLYQATGEDKYVRGAKVLFEFVDGGSSDVYANTMNHKYLWGCARLYHATRDQRHLEAALRIADFLTSIQEPEGTWWHSGYIPSRDQQTKGATVDITSQFCIWLIKLLQVI